MVICLLDLNATPLDDDGDDEDVLGVGEAVASEEDGNDTAQDEGINVSQDAINIAMDEGDAVSEICDTVCTAAKKAATLPAKSGLSLLSFGKKCPPNHRDTVSCLVLHVVAGLLYTGSHDHTVKAWKLSDDSCVDSFVAHDGAINAMLINEADGCIFTGSTDGLLEAEAERAGIK
ncbi:hypothetical protein ABZP36_033240 [Zizania latifolia]